MQGLLEAHLVLLEREVPHDVIHLPARISSADALPLVLGLPTERCMAVRVYRTATGPVATAVCAGQWPDRPLLVAALQRRKHATLGLRPATPGEVNAATDYQAELVSPLALPSKVLLLVDVAMLRSPVVYLPTGDAGTAVGAPIRDLLTATGAHLAELTRARSSAHQTEIVLDADRASALASEATVGQG